MADLIHNFTSGRMNKDLDERLVPNGEYRDALNLQIANSTTSQVGAFQNIKGNLEKKNQTYTPSTGVYTEWNSNYISSLPNAICIGSIADNTTEYIYWFIASDTASVIASYNTITKVTAPVLVDTQNILKFKADYLITGINVLEGMLLWTDNQTEPKKINIQEWINSTPNFVTHSQIYGRNFIESDITVIKKFPLSPLTVTALETARLNSSGQVANVDTNTTASFFYLDPNGDIVPLTPSSGPVTLNWSGGVLPYYNIGDTLILTNGQNDPLDKDAVIRVMVDSIIGIGDNQTGAVVSVLSVGVTPGVTITPTFYDVTLEQDSPFFEFKFARFAYRWKYKNNELSAFSPFTNPVFIPGEFDYNPSQGYNLGMVNNIRQLKLSDYITSDIPDDVVEVDLLYKDSVSTNVYVVDSFKPNDPEWANNSFNIKTEIISTVVQSNQLIRPYDNVPRWAKAQEITANRLIYANYTQNFNLLDSGGVPLQIGLTASFSSDIISPNANNELIGTESIKTIRTYQAGVAYMDPYGRTTPVFTSNEASITLGKSQAAFANSINVKIQNSLPYYNQTDQFTNFKYFIKETSREYYNLSLDRFYDAEDGNVWLSFPSAERNKVDEETFLILKKEHANSNPVTEQAKYKIIAIENEAPLYLKETKINMGTLSTTFTNSGFPMAGVVSLEVDQTAYKKEFGDDAPTTSGLIMRVGNGSTFSEWYKISSTSAPTTTVYRLTSDKVFGDDMNFTSTQPYGYANKVQGLVLQVAYIDTQNKPEFTGRFFVKVNKDSLLTQKIIEASNSTNTNYFRKSAAPLYLLRGTYTSRSFWAGAGASEWGRTDAQGQKTRWFIDYSATDCEGAKNGTDTAGVMNIAYAGGGFNDDPTAYTEFISNLTSNGSLFRFVDDPDQTVYEITGTTRQNIRTYACASSNSRYKDFYNKMARYKVNFKKKNSWGGLTWNPVGTVLTASNNLTQFAEMEFIGVNPDDDSFTTNNPAIFETEPKESTELNIYWEVPGTYDASAHGMPHKLDWFNCYSFGNGVESNRIRDDFNAATMGNGVKASATLEEPYKQESRFNGLIFSQIFNSTSGINNLNQFIQGEAITKDLLPEYGSIQKLRSRDTNLIALCEDKCLSILADKDALYNADGNTNLTSGRYVLGQAQAYAGEYGISTNPESFAEYGTRIYFTDKSRGVVLRLSQDGVTEISSKGLLGFFNDNLFLNKNIFGSWDAKAKEYNVTLNTLSPYWQNLLGVGEVDRLNKSDECGTFLNSLPTRTTTISYKEEVDGWTGRKTYIPESGVSINSLYYTFKNGKIWEHYSNPIHNNFYNVGIDDQLIGKYYESSFNLIINEDSNTVKTFNTVNYTGTQSLEYVYRVSGYGNRDFSIAEIQADNLIPATFTTNKGWYVNSLVTDLQEGKVKEFIDKEDKKFNYIKGLQTFFNTNCNNNVDSSEFNVQGIGRASEINGDVEPTVYNVTVFADPNCFEEIQIPTLANQNFIGNEDQIGTYSISQTNNCGEGITIQLVNNATTGGTLSAINPNGSFTFTPNENYNGSAGAFTAIACCGDLCSAPATMTLNITPVSDNPYFTTTNPSLSGLKEGDCWTYSPIGLASADFDSTDLFIQLPVTGLPSWMSQPQPLNDGSGDWYIPNSCVPDGQEAGTIDFTLTVEDPHGSTGQQKVGGNTIVTSILALEFIASANDSMGAQTWTNPLDPTEVVTMAPRINSGHGCNRGCYRVVANKHVNGGVVIGRVWNSNLGTRGTAQVPGIPGGGDYFNTFTVSPTSGYPTSPTQDPIAWTGTPAALAQGNLDSLGNPISCLYKPTDPEWGSDPVNSLQRYVNATIAGPGSTQYGHRYSYLQVTQTDADNIAANFADPNNPSYVTFTIEPDTYQSGGVLNTHGDAVQFQIFQKGSTAGYANGAEIFSGGLYTTPTTFPSITIDVTTGAIITNQ